MKQFVLCVVMLFCCLFMYALVSFLEGSNVSKGVVFNANESKFELYKK